MPRGRAAGTRAKRCACQQDAPNLAAGAAKTGGVRVCRGSAGRTGLGQDSSTSIERGRGEFAPVASATVRAIREAAAAAMWRACPDLWKVLREVLWKLLPYVLRHDLRSAPFGWRFVAGLGLPDFDWQGPDLPQRPAGGFVARTGAREVDQPAVTAPQVLGPHESAQAAHEVHCQKAHSQNPAVWQRRRSHRA